MFVLKPIRKNVHARNKQKPFQKHVVTQQRNRKFLVVGSNGKPDANSSLANTSKLYIYSSRGTTATIAQPTKSPKKSKACISDEHSFYFQTENQTVVKLRYSKNCSYQKLVRKTKEQRQTIDLYAENNSVIYCVN